MCQIKRNCRKLWEICALYTALARPISTFEYYEDAHGHQIYRRVELYENKAELPKGWNGIERIVKVRRWGYRNKKEFEEVSFYALSKPIYHASIVAKAIQEHWGIENKLHWSKDVHLGEDKMTLKDKQQVKLLVYLNNIAINILKANGMKSNKDTYAKITNKVYELIKLFT
ncbi:MAG: ISAs1 family transposase [Saprospiraceae bacterium]|nr:ISAs1 family transposase [Saprospiraceae bacterium]